MFHHHFLLLTVWLGSNVFACPEGWWRSRVTDDLCLTQPQQDGILIQDSWATLHWECRKLGATLVSIRTTNEIEELIELVPEKSWIGLASFDSAGKWQWSRASFSEGWPLANTTLFWGSENKTTVGRLRCGSLRSNGTIVVSHCGLWQVGICELRLNESKVPNLPKCIGSQVNSIQNESICYARGDLYAHPPKCSGGFKMYVLPTSFADIESMLALGNPCYDEQCFDRGNYMLYLPIRHLPNTDRWLNVYINMSVNWTNWAQSNATENGDCAVLNIDGFWERKPCESDDVVHPNSICVGALENAPSSSTIRPATVEPPRIGRSRSLCPPGAIRINTFLDGDSTCLFLSFDRLPWAAAGQRCRAMGGQLADSFILHEVYFESKWMNGGIWIGFTALSGQWAWSLNQINGTDWLQRYFDPDVSWDGIARNETKSKIDKSGRSICASAHFGGFGAAKAENCGRAMRYICMFDIEQLPLPTPACRWNSRILTSDTTSCLSIAYRNVSYNHLNETCAKFGGIPFLPSSALENEILLANGQKWNENSTSAPALGQDLVWLSIRLDLSVRNSPTFWAKWAPGHPQHHVDCAVVDASNGLWYSLDCSDSRPSGVCRVPAGLLPAPLNC